MSQFNNGWDQLLLDAMDVPEQIRINYVAELRNLFQLKLEAQVVALGFPVRRAISSLPANKTNLLYREPFFDLRGEPHDAEFCLKYGTDGYSFRALNYRYNYHNSHRLDAFVQAHNPLLLGNFGVGINAPASGLMIEPPPEITVTGICEVASGKKTSITGWLGVRYCAMHCYSEVIAKLASVEWTEPVGGSIKHPAYFCGDSTFIRMLADLGYDTLSILREGKEKEASLRMEMGFPPKGKPIREQILYEIVFAIFGRPQVIRHYRGKELQGLELDILIPELRIGFEYQGEQHYKRLPHWQKSPEAFSAQQERDNKKAQLCQQLGIHLVHLNAKDKLDRLSILLKLRTTGALSPYMHPHAWEKPY